MVLLNVLGSFSRLLNFLSLAILNIYVLSSILLKLRHLGAPWLRRRCLSQGCRFWGTANGSHTQAHQSSARTLNHLLYPVLVPWEAILPSVIIPGPGSDNEGLPEPTETTPPANPNPADPAAPFPSCGSHNESSWPAFPLRLWLLTSLGASPQGPVWHVRLYLLLPGTGLWVNKLPPSWQSFPHLCIFPYLIKANPRDIWRYMHQLASSSFFHMWTNPGSLKGTQQVLGQPPGRAQLWVFPEITKRVALLPTCYQELRLEICCEKANLEVW